MIVYTIVCKSEGILPERLISKDVSEIAALMPKKGNQGSSVSFRL